MTTDPNFQPFRVVRTTAETRLAVAVRPGWSGPALLPIPNRLLSHLLDHLCKGVGITLELAEGDWSGSWPFDHVWCEDLGQLIGRAAAEIHGRRCQTQGVAGRASLRSCMDDVESVVSLSFEGRGSVSWSVPPAVDVDGWVDAWYEPGSSTASAAYGTNLRQFIDGFALGGGVTVSVDVVRAGNLHHLFETIFRNLGDAVGLALGTASVHPGQTSGLAATPQYTIEDV
jgi:imidazoleglycerol phosphate dehydratase HisB